MEKGRGRIAGLQVSLGGVPKLPVSEARVGTEGLSGDAQRNRKLHGGPDRAVCLYSLERIRALQAEGHPVVPGALGENVTVEGLDWAIVVPGVRLRFGDVLLEVVKYTRPCAHLRPSLIDGDFLRVDQDRHPGWSRVYARVLSGGLLRVGGEVVLT